MMKTSNPLLSLWINPRKTIRQATVTYSPRNDLRLVALLSISYLIQIILFIVMVDAIPSSAFLSQKNIEAIIWILIAMSGFFYAYAYLTSLMIWTISKWFKGSGNLTNTRTALLWSMLSYLPAGFSILLVYFAYNQKLIGKPIFLLDIISLIGLPIAFIYSFILAFKMIAEIQQFSLWRAFLSLFLCALLQGGIVFALFTLIIHKQVQ